MTCRSPLLSSIPYYTNRLSVGLKHIPSAIANLHRTLSVLVIEGNPQITHIPQEIGLCTKIALLVFKDTSMRELPSSIGLLTNMATMSLVNNKLASIPSEFGQLANLASFWITSNQVEQIPTELGRLSSLKDVGMAGNKLTQVPFVDMRMMPQLRYLDLQDNAIEAVPANWRTVKTVNMSQLLTTKGKPLTTSLDDVYDMYLRVNAGSTTLGDDPCLTKLGGNPIATSSSASPYSGNVDVVYEVSTFDEDFDQSISSLLVAVGKDCAAGCSIHTWEPSNLGVYVENGWCDRVCNVSACNFDGGDCYTV